MLVAFIPLVSNCCNCFKAGGNLFFPGHEQWSHSPERCDRITGGQTLAKENAHRRSRTLARPDNSPAALRFRASCALPRHAQLVARLATASSTAFWHAGRPRRGAWWRLSSSETDRVDAVPLETQKPRHCRWFLLHRRSPL